MPPSAAGATHLKSSMFRRSAISSISSGSRSRPCRSSPARRAARRNGPVSARFTSWSSRHSRSRPTCDATRLRTAHPALPPCERLRPPLPTGRVRPASCSTRAAAGMFSSGTTIGSSICDDLGALVLEPRWQQQVHPELFPRFVAREATLGGRRALGQNAARRTTVDRVEVVAVLDLRAVGVAELLVEPFCSASFSSLSTSSAM